MQAVIISAGVGAVTVGSVIGAIVKARHQKRKLKKMPKHSETVRLQKR